VLHLPGAAGDRTALLATEPGPFAPQRARDLSVAACRVWGLRSVSETVALVADELVTNAVIHARTFLELHLQASDDELLVAVHDRDERLDPKWWDAAPVPFGPGAGLTDPPTLPVRGRDDGSDDSTREDNTGDAAEEARFGLCLVRRSADRFGSYRHPGRGKVMWAAVGIPHTGSSSTGSSSTGSTGIPSSTVPPDLGAVDVVSSGPPPSGRRSSGELPSGALSSGPALNRPLIGAFPLRQAPAVAGAQPEHGEHSQPNSASVRRSVLVNGVRRSVHHRRGRWRLELLLGWEPDEPDVIDLRLRPTPLHPALPTGHWRVGRDELAAGLDGAAGSRSVHFYPDPAGLVLLIELAANPPQVVHAPLRQVRAFLDEVLDAQAGRSRPNEGSSG